MRALGPLATRLLRSRYGLALGIAALVAAVLTTTSLLVSAESPSAVAPAVAPIPTAHPTVGDDGERAPATPTLSPLPGPPPAAVARAFTKAWLSGRGQPAGWHGRLGRHATAGLRGKLADADPASVPPARARADAEVTPLSADIAEVTVPTDAGRLLLRLLVEGGGWRVDAVDWEPA